MVTTSYPVVSLYKLDIYCMTSETNERECWHPLNVKIQIVQIMITRDKVRPQWVLIFKLIYM